MLEVQFPAGGKKPPGKEGRYGGSLMIGFINSSKNPTGNCVRKLLFRISVFMLGFCDLRRIIESLRVQKHRNFPWFIRRGIL